MKRWDATKRAVLSIALAAFSLSVTGADKPPPNPQQVRMAACNKEAGDKHGDERKSFMFRCLADKKLAQQEKLKTCAEQAADKQGDERKAFLSNCSKN
jgi:hypothetical protein